MREFTHNAGMYMLDLAAKSRIIFMFMGFSVVALMWADRYTLSLVG